MIAGMKGKNLSRPQTAVKIALLRHNSNALLDAHRISGNIDTHNKCAAAGRAHIGCQDADSCRLAGPVWS